MASLDEYMTRAVTHYSSLFTLPSHSQIILSLVILCTLSGVAVAIPIPRSFRAFVLGLFFGAVLLLGTLLFDFIIARCYMKADPIFDLRRCSALSVFSWVIWFFFALLGSVTSILVEDYTLLTKVFFLGSCPVLVLRLLVFTTVSLTSSRASFVSSILQPAFGVMSFLFIGPLLGYVVPNSLLLIPLLSVLIAIITVFLFTFLLNYVGKSSIGIASLSLFKAFLANWITDANELLEGVFENLGVEKNIEISLLGFRTKNKMKAVVVVPACHRGPFKNVGSSLLPYFTQEALRDELRCVVAVPHGLVGHEMDLSSQVQTEKVLEGVRASVDSFSTMGSQATSFVRVQKDEAKASCQIFGACALYTLTLAPKTTEDFPQELAPMIAEESEKSGIAHTIVINAHNSLESATNPNRSVALLRKAAAASLEKTLLDKQRFLEIGAAAIIPHEFSVKEGMGPGGISVIAVKVGDHKTAYVTVDGNNVVSGLREKILSALRELGVSDGEVLTTDTHAVNGVVQIARGYHPVGEVIDQEKLIDYVIQATAGALNNLEPAEALWTSKVVPNVKVIGRKQIEQLCLLAERTLSRAKKLAVLLFPSAGLLLLALVLLL